MHGREIQADPKLQQTCRYRSLCFIFTKISSRASESEKSYELANAHVMDLARLVEDILRLEIYGSTQESSRISRVEHTNIAKAKGLKKESSLRRRRFNSSLEVALTKKIRKRG